MNTYYRLLRRLPYLLLGSFLFAAAPLSAELMLYPTRIVFDGNDRAARVELMNNGATETTYRLSLVNRRMSETGEFSDVDEPLPGERFADDLIRYSPRQVTLAPGKGQTVRLLVRKPSGLAAGEYRSHLLFTELPEARAPEENLEEGQIGIRLQALVSVSIPVIVRHGDTSASVRFTSLNLEREAGEPVLEFSMEREGNQSVYGDISVTFTPRSGESEVLARANGVAVYTPNPVRRIRLPLHVKEGAALRNGTLEVRYREQADDGGELMASESLVLP